MAMTDPLSVEKTDPGTVFAVLSDDARVDILRALADADDREVTFSALRDAIGMRDSGQFNYHLEKLLDRFVTKTDDGYTLTQAGKQIIGAIEAGAYTMDASIDPITLPEPCPLCGGTRRLEYEDETMRIECADCPSTYEFIVPPGVLDGCDREAIPEVASRYLRTTFHHITSGFCWFCDGQLQPTIGASSDITEQEDIPADWEDQLRNLPMVRYDCERCGATSRFNLEAVLLHHPAVVGFFYEHGINVEDRPLWTLSVLDPERTSITDGDPFSARAHYRIDGDELAITVDETLEIVDIERHIG